jgi:cyclic beta-1,2-glucan synthetase
MELPLMGSDGWNEGMSRVGIHGRGESIWLAFFLFKVLTEFAEIDRGHGDNSFAQLCLAESAALRQNIEKNGWDGRWYLRAYFDDGKPLGSASNPERKIDSLPRAGPFSRVQAAQRGKMRP